jgi:alanine-glyoxylate transaminase / serine-glyoxylate transaminase / serine-pyruvate transaminase
MKNRKLLMIPGPIEFDSDVLAAMSMPTESHVSPDFIECFGKCLDLMQEIWQAPVGQAFIIAGSGTLSMDMAAANLVERGDQVLVVSSGYFGERFETIFKRYGAETKILSLAPGESVSIEAIEEELKANDYKILSFTHVDTSTGVLMDAQRIGALCRKYNVLSVLDGVCSVAAEEIKQEAWGLDVVLTASQKAIGVPPGLALLVASPLAMESWSNRKTEVGNYYADWSNWLPIMQAYQSRKPSYFGTPPVNLIMALELSLTKIKAEGITVRFARHKTLANAFRKAIDSIGLKMVPRNESHAASTLSAVYYPKDIDPGKLLKNISEKNVIMAGGLHPEIKHLYFRVGHMGSVNSNDLMACLSALEFALQQQNFKFEAGKSLRIFQEAISS